MSTPEQPTETAEQLPNEQEDEPAEPMFRVIIKNPTDTPGNAPFSLSLAPSTTVQRLKQTLSDTYPGNPATSAQRLIHAGKLLTDAATLSSVLPPDTDTTHTMHLVVSTGTDRPQRSTPSSQPPVSNPPLQYPPNPHPFPQNFNNLPPNYNPYFAPLHGHPAPYPFPHPPPQPGAAPHFPHADPHAYAQHLHAVERVIAQALHTLPQNPNDPAQRAQIAALLDAAAALHGQPPPYPFPQPNQPPQNQHDHRHHTPENQNPQQQEQPQQNQNVPPNNPLGFDFRVHRQNAPRVRHFVFQFELNWSLITKLAFLVYLLSQEGNTTRVYFLIMIALSVYLWRLGHLRFLRAILPTALPSPNRFVNILFPARAPRFARARVALSFAYSFVYGFFCSLLPAWDPERMPDVIRLAEPEDNDPINQANPGDSQTAGNQEPHEHAD